MSTFAPGDARGPAFAAAVAGFTAQTGIKVKTVFAGATEIFNAYETAELAGQEPDVLIVNLYDKALTWTQSGATIPLTSELTQWGLNKVINPEAVKEWTDSQGRLQGLPYLGFSWPFWFNTALLKSAGISSIPTTIDQLLADTKLLRAKGITPVAVGGDDSSGQKFVLQVMETTMTPSEAQTVLAKGGYCSNADAMKGLNLFVQLKNAGVFSADAEGLSTEDMYAQFTTDKAAIMPAGSWAFSLEPKSQLPDISLGGFPLPSGSPLSKPIAYEGFSAAGFWLTPNGQKRIKDYEAFVKYMYSPSVVSRFVSGDGDVPVINLPNSSTVLAKQPLLLKALTTLPSTVTYGTFPDFSVPGQITAAMTTATTDAFAKSATAQSICSSLDATYK